MLKIVQQSVELPASPAALYSMYLDPAQHAAFTGGGPASITATPGTAWSVVEGVTHRIAIETAEMRHLPFAAGDFDVVLSQAAIAPSRRATRAAA